MGNLDKVAVRQIDYRGLLRSTEESKTGGMTLEEETVHGATSRYSEDAIVNLCIALEDLHIDVIEPLTPNDVLPMSIEILDHLDTLGMEVRFKDDSRRVDGPAGA